MQFESQNIRRSYFFIRLLCRYVRFLLLFLTGLTVSAILYLLYSELQVDGRDRVYAVESSALANGVGSVQVGLTGMMNGVANMQRYADDVRMVSVTDASDEDVLAGVKGISRSSLRQQAFVQSSAAASSLGYFAEQAIQNWRMSESEYQTLLQIVEAEATGGDVMSKMLVAGVVLNRVKDSRFPDTITDVVWQSSQFQPTYDGRYYSVTVTDETVEAVDRVLNGEDYSQGALFFAARDSAETKNMEWFDASLVRVMEYGGHEFFTFRDEEDD